MAVSVESFLESHPEFTPAGASLIGEKLAEAALEVDVALWGVRADTGIKLTAAHLLAVSPFGQQARLVSKDGSTTYSTRLIDLRKLAAAGIRLV